MNMMNTILAARHDSDTGQTLLARLRAIAPIVSEAFWFCLSFLLFLVMGPFSAIAVLIGLFSLASEENRQKMTEPASA